MISTIIKNKTVLVYPLKGIIDEKGDFTYYRTIHVETASKQNWISQYTASNPDLFLSQKNGKELIIKSNGKLEIHG